MFSLDEFAQLRFLEGRWKGSSPDGKEFFEEYDRPEPGVFQSHRFADATFTGRGDGATISLRDGEVVSQWNDYTWRAARIGPDSADFEPLSAPSRFSWRRVDEATLEATQHWTADGKEQQYTLRMQRIGA